MQEASVSESARALVVDDDIAIRSVLAEALSDDGFEVRAAGDGQEALDILSEWQPNVILLDLMMPIVDGWAFRDRQRADPAIADIPVVVLSAVRDLRSQFEALAARAAFTKPFDLDQVLKVVRDITG